MECEDSGLQELASVLARSGRILEGSEVVMSEQLGMVLRVSERLDPLGREPVELAPTGAWDLAVRDVA
jgi:hypothetical protein